MKLRSKKQESPPEHAAPGPPEDAAPTTPDVPAATGDVPADPPEEVAAVTWAPPEDAAEAEQGVADDPTVKEPSAPDHGAAVSVTHNGPRLGEMLESRGALTSEMIQQALLEQTNSGRRLGEILVEQGIISESELVNALSEQLDLELVDLRRVSPEPEAVVLVPESLVRAHRALPVNLADDDLLLIAVPGPLPNAAVDELRSASGKNLRFVLAPASDVERAIDRSYDALSGLDRVVATFQPGMGDPTAEAQAAGALVVDENAPIVQIFQRILTQAVRERASDLHIEPQSNSVRVRFRVDGALHDAVRLPAVTAQSLVSRIKILAEMNIVERRRAQDGQFEATVDGRPLDVRVATIATIWGEKAVLRLLDKSRSLLQLDRLGMPRETRTEFSLLIGSPYGMVICAGPTGSGKTTTLYAALSEINDSDRNIMTIEDPVEYVMPSINQIQINEQADITFSGGLKAILRQDPDIILVGEMRDIETARIAVQSALTGHLVLSSLHATDATAALHRFLDMGIESFLVASSITGVVAQRLVRRVCVACREPYEPSVDELALYEQWGGKPKDEFLRGAGCNFCAHTGYSERIGVYELLRATEQIKELIVRRAPLEELRAMAVAQGMRTLREEALRIIDEDTTTISEVLRSIYLV
jgi:type IV pilus assembly protein PilB